MANKITYDKYDIVFQEIPNEVSLAFTIEGCPNRCANCHSPHLREQNGIELTYDHYHYLLINYLHNATCVLFLGGDAFHEEIYDLAKYARMIGYKTAFYSGNDVLNEKLMTVLNYYKIGSYREELGGLNYTTTNQRLFKRTYKNGLEDITGEFWNESNSRK